MPSPEPNTAVEEKVHCGEWADNERDAIIDETTRILADRTFKNSKRCQVLFRFLVDRALEGDHVGVKERTLGVEVFGREPSYDTSVDPIVRVAANEIRKRLAQWYQEPLNHSGVVIRLTAGSYFLKFDFVPHDNQPITEEASHPDEARGSAKPQTTGTAVDQAVTALLPPRRRTKWMLGAAVAILACLAVFLVTNHFDIFQSKDYLAWKPLLDSPRPVTICVPDAFPLGKVADPLATEDTEMYWQTIADMIAKRQLPAHPAPRDDVRPNTPLADAEVAEKFSTWLAMHGGKMTPRGSSAVSLADFREGPAVLIGGFNPWSLILLSNLRYSVRVDPGTHDKWIQDAQNPSKRDWIFDGGMHHMDVDFAIITRVLDAETGQWILSVGGLRQYGTQAGTDLLVDKSYGKLLPADVKPAGNFQIILRTAVIGGSAGPPQILAVHTW